MLTTIGYTIIAIVNFGLLLWCIRLLRQTKSWLSLCVMLPMTLLWFDSIIIGYGKYIGEGDTLLMLSYPRYWSHALLLPAMYVSAILIAKEAGFKILGSDLAVKLSIVFALCLSAYDGYLTSLNEYFPLCVADTLRYATSVSAAQACYPEQIGMGSSHFPFAPIGAIVLLLILGVMLWVRHKWPWLAVGSAVMFGVNGVPQDIAGPIFSNMGEPVISGALIWTASWAISLNNNKNNDTVS